MASGLIAVLALAGAGCGNAPKQQAHAGTSIPATIRVSSNFISGAAIPVSYTCDGQNLSPPLRAVGLPAATVELVVVMRDRDARGGNFVHWAIAQINPHLVVFGRAGSVFLRVAGKPPGAIFGRNSFGSLGYRGPCPPPGTVAHHYEIAVYALGRRSMLDSGFSAAAISGLDVLAIGKISGVYSRR